MAIWIQSLSWTLIYALGQGFVVYSSLWLVLKLVPAISSNIKYHLSLSALTVLLAWFASTWWQQYHSLAVAGEQLLIAQKQHTIFMQLPLINDGAGAGSDLLNTAMSSVRVILPWLSAFYIVGLMFMLVRLSADVLQLFSLRKSEISQPDQLFSELLTSLKGKLHFEGGVQLLVSARAHVPMVIGFFKPIILMPAAAMAQLSTRQLETILLHELAHIRRYDYLVNMLQTVVETILFFNPFVWLISAITRREREHCCDDLVLVHTREPLCYATALAALATNPGTVSTFTVAASGQSNHLFHRIKRIMEMKKNPFSYSRMFAAILMITVIVGSLVWLTPSFAQSKKSKQGAAIASATPKTAQKDAVKADLPEETVLIQQMMNDRLIDQVKGFVVEKKLGKLYIDGKEQPDQIAGKYLSLTKKDAIRVQVFSFMERLKQHPDANLLQIIAPVSMQSGCVDYEPKKPGC